MEKKHILSGVLTAACTAVILGLVLVQTRVALRPNLHISFSPPPIAYGYAFRNVFISGVVYNDDGKTPVGANRVVAVTFNGGSIRGTGATTSTGYYVIYPLSHSGAGTVVTTYLRNATEDAATVTTLSGGNLVNFDLYRNSLIARSDSGSFPLTITHLNTGDNNGAADLNAVYRAASNSLIGTQSGKSLWIWRGDTFKPGGSVSAGSGITVAGTFQPEGNTITLSGSWAKKSAGTFTFATSTVVMNGANQTLSGSTTFKNFTKIAASSNTLSFNTGLTQTFTGTLTLRGTQSARLKLRSSSGSVQWSINPQSTRDVTFLDVKSSRNVNATVINCVVGCVDSGSNLLWNFGTFWVQGGVYSDKGSTGIGAGRIVAAAINGGTRVATGVTTSTGQYLLSNMQYTGGLLLSVFLDNGADKAVTTTILSSTGLTSLNLYKDHLILRSDSGSTSMTNTLLATADNTADADLLSVFHVDSSSALGSGSGRTVFVWAGDTYAPGGRVKTHDLDVRGTMTLGTNGLVASGSVLVSGTMTTSTGILLTSVDSESLALTGVTLQTITVDNGLWGYWKMDDGTGSLVRDSSRYNHSGSITGIPVTSTSSGWVAGTTGAILFYDPSALLFDGSGDYVDTGDSIDPADGQDFTITAWVNRSTATNKHTILSKKSSTGASAAGYALWLDDATDTLQFAASDGTDTYHLLSTSTFASPGWRHIAVVWDDDSASKTELYVGGAADSATDTGTIGNVNDLGNAVNLRIGTEPDSQYGFHGKIDDVRIYRRALGPSEILKLAQGNKATGSGTYVLGSNIDINSDLRIYGGTIEIPSGINKTITVAGNIDNQGGFTRGSGTVTLDGTNQTVSGSTMFNVFRKIAASAMTLYLDFTSRQSASGSIAFSGADASTKLSLRSTKSGSVARMFLDPNGGQTLTYLNVRDQSASGGTVLACTTSCTDSGNNHRWSFTCGDGVVSSAEGCDDGDATSGDGCSSSCTVESGFTCTGAPSSCSTTCGDSIIAGSETCDNGDQNSDAPDTACRSNCGARRCGDGIKDSGEGCDDGNDNNNDTCLSTCVQNTGGAGGGGASSSNTSYYKRPLPPDGCGNAILEKSKGEQCDEGRFNDLGTCSYECRIRYCGDGEITVIIGEECEPTPTAGPNGERLYDVASCGQVCTAPDTAGRGGCKINYLTSCDAASSAYSSAGTYYPPTDGTDWEQDFGGDAGTGGFSECGNGVVQEGEECDDENPFDGDGCSAMCRFEGDIIPVCGDGILIDGEDCDDGNNTDGDGCSAYCIREHGSGPLCGNGAVNDGEECDNAQGNSDTAPDTCRRSCTNPVCGDFVPDRGEQCDQGSANSALESDRCRPGCILPSCGDGVRDSGEECDGSLGCSDRCSLDFQAPQQCGNGTFDSGEDCDDGNRVNGDGCTERCNRELPKSPTELAQALNLVLDADIIIVNPTEIAVALKFLSDPDPCATVTASGEDVDAAAIRAAAAKQNIPIVKNVPLAHAIRSEHPVGSTVKNPWCTQVNMLRGTQASSSSSLATQSASSSAPAYVPMYRPIASFIPATPTHAPIGDTGPGAIILIGAGAAGAVGWIRRKKFGIRNAECGIIPNS